MSTNSLSHPAARLLARHYVELLTVLAVLFVLQTGLVPFDFAGERGRAGSNELFGTMVTHLTLPDIVSNIFLYVPIGILLHWSLSRAVKQRALALLAAIALAAALSGGVEWIQAYSPVRVSSIIDFVSNVAGATLGVSISWVGRWILPGLVGAALYELHERPQAFLLKAYCCVLVIFATIPFSFSFDVVRFKNAVKSATFVPFAAIAAPEPLADDVRAEGEHFSYSHLKWRRMKCWSRWSAECASFAVLAWLMQSFVRGCYGFGRRVTTLLVWWLCGALAIGLSILQLPIVSRACDVTDILFRLAGVWLCLVTRSGYLRDSERLTPALQARRWRGVAKTGCVATVGYIVYISLIPLTFDAASESPAVSLASESFLPFFAYFLARFDLMMIDVMEKFASYFVFSALLAICWKRVSDVAVGWASPTTHRSAGDKLVGGAHPTFAITAVGVAIAAVIEVAQMFIPVRVTSLTDLILAGAGCLTGVLAQQHAVRFYHFATSQTFLRREDAPQFPASAPDLPPADALIGTLIEPRPDAPAEPAPTGSPTEVPRPFRGGD